ncbi:MAG: bifunctional 3-demethylubiquinol 3-O-methyltransferase/2-polyprenyl-6-hydroxyphenol methylase [Gammaproteobacteria bacterium RIFCSPLOWO2_02_47_7]|nr:MAG: bifunctional 3-demethylubiquinol 3-O-methyltransferase/2-polyprenyl-6-hydroxyphenol methylase [Gammaproteobacteria bacterium RIFCSPLOWO2_02_47_7]OGT65727.1 MAG: bifunctional 3-demethylubiquinol 3-O-methyltransferase/2-polyprenyl-6-hydroxyphenol methylase [Gammaproteobacteria bacterium RIFCSPLOWO2_01_FULL_47_190]OGT73184.1 MAG: bifunctional 3-demethylubiquinol 3-O-methyltransferase/2-polyprenyl-6-hydroxyphenol methylase [Gammaproteobacteria bacterium RIFCSPLOWO2_12_47_11]OGT86843.1 MAG: b
MVETYNNIDKAEKNKFEALANDWWDPDGPLKTLHDINELRLDYIGRYTNLSGKTVVDVGCGAGILTEAMARKNAIVTGMDISPSAIAVAKQHSRNQALNIDYHLLSPEEFAENFAHQFEVVTCMEMLEHVPDPASVVSACATMLKPGGHVFFSTINRTARAYMFAVLGAEYILKALPAGTHDYSRFIRPSELSAWCQQYGLAIHDISGMSYSPLSRKAALRQSPDVNYLLHAC